MGLEYLDFDIEIGQGTGREYPISVRSPAGEARATMLFPFDELALENRLLVLQNVLLRSGGKRRLALSQDEATVQEFGKALFDAVLVDDARSLFYECRRLADQRGAGVRVRLRFASPTLAALPWEFLYDPRQGHVSLSANTPMVRYLELPQPPQPLAIAPPLRILGMITSPSDLPDLDLERERARLERAIAPLREQGLVELVWLEGQGWRDLQDALQLGPWHVFHFAGHGAFDPNTDEGLVMLADEEGRSRPLRATELGRLLADHRPLRLAVLNACEGGRGSQRDVFSSTASILVKAGLPAVVAMQYEITDNAAIELTRTFYKALANKLPVDAALAEARKAVSLGVANTFEWGTPVLYMRAPDGVLFDLASRAEPVPAPLAAGVATEAAVRSASQAIQPKAPEPVPRKTRAGPAAIPTSVPATPEPGRSSLRRLWLPIAGLAIAIAVIGIIIRGSGIIPGVQPPVPTESFAASAGATQTVEAQVTETAAVAVLSPTHTPTAPISTVAARITATHAAQEKESDVALVPLTPTTTSPPVAMSTPEPPTPTPRPPTATPRPPTPAPTAVPDKVALTGDRAIVTEPVRMELVRVPAGEFIMGSDPEKDPVAGDDEKPQHKIYLADFEIGRTEVTVAQFEAFVNATGHQTTAEKEGSGYAYTGSSWEQVEGADWSHPRGPDSDVSNKGNHPVTQVSWHDALAFCRWAGLRLPTEAEWEKAARGTEGQIYPWGGEDPNDSLTNFNSNVGDTRPVGSYPDGASPYGALDMAGNVWEWTISVYADYPYDPADGREDVNSTGSRVLRGGSWVSVARSVRAARRGGVTPDDRSGSNGFRCARSG